MPLLSESSHGHFTPIALEKIPSLVFSLAQHLQESASPISVTSSPICHAIVISSVSVPLSHNLCQEKMGTEPQSFAKEFPEKGMF